MKKAGLKLNFQKTKIMASEPITSWQIDGGKKMETVTNFIFMGFKITVESDYSHEMKRCLFLGRKAIINVNSVLENRHHFTDKGLSNQNYGFSSSHV